VVPGYCQEPCPRPVPCLQAWAMTGEQIVAPGPGRPAKRLGPHATAPFNTVATSPDTANSGRGWGLLLQTLGIRAWGKSWPRICRERPSMAINSRTQPYTWTNPLTAYMLVRGFVLAGQRLFGGCAPDGTTF
jgi:hypothetical protein